jgi:hypothetical protein
MKCDEHFIKERTGHLEKNIKYGLRVFFLERQGQIMKGHIHAVCKKIYYTNQNCVNPQAN